MPIAKIALLFGLFLLDMSLSIPNIKFAFPFALFSEWWMILLWAVLVDGFFPQAGSGIAIAVVVMVLRFILTDTLRLSITFSRFFTWILIIEFSDYFYPAGVMIGGYWIFLGFIVGMLFGRWKK